MKRFKGIIITLGLFLTLLTTGCHDAPDYVNDAYGNFDALVDIIDTRYCFFEEKDINWKEVAQRYRKELKPGMTYLDFFNICASMLDELKDGHVNLTSQFNTSYYRAWWSDYPQDFNLRTLQQYYLGFDYMQISGISYKLLDEEIGYMYYPSFSSGISEASLDNILYYFKDCKALILDIRDNGGGLLSNIDILVGRFINHETPGGSIRHKTGPGHNDFSEPFLITYKPSLNRVGWETDKPIYVLTNRSCFSAANDFVAVMKSLPNVKIVGAKTGGGGGLPFSSELPIGWAIRFSACPMTAPDGSVTEFGIEPSEGYECHSPDSQLAEGTDNILEFALRAAKGEATK